MITFKKNEYWHEFKIYQSFDSAEQMFNDVKLIQKTFNLSDAEKSFLNTIKLHSKNIFGVCFLKVSEIAKKAGIHPATAHRAKNKLTEAKIIAFHNQIHSKKGGKAPNVYVIQPFSSIVAASLDDSLDASLDASSQTTFEEPSIPCGTSVSDVSDESYKNLDINLYNNSKNNLKTLEKNDKDYDILTYSSLSVKGETKETDLTDTSAKSDTSVSSDNGVASNSSTDSNNSAYTATSSEEINTSCHDDSLNHIPDEFKSVFNPFYANNTEIILARWKSTCVAAKKACDGIANLSFDIVRKAWKMTVSKYKANKIKDSSDDGLGAYYYSTLKKMITDVLKANSEVVEAVECPELENNTANQSKESEVSIKTFKGTSKHAKPMIPIVQYEDEATVVSDEELEEMIRFAEAMQSNKQVAAGCL